GGKSWTMRIGPVRNIGVRGFQAVVFRRTLQQIKKPGGMWDKSYELYPLLGGRDSKAELKWRFPAGSAITYSHLQHEHDWLDWQGTETTMFCFDQLEEFTQLQFLKILGCMRSTCGVRTQMFCTMNPDADSWLRDFVDPWIAEDGYVDLAKNGTLRYFTIQQDQVVWVDADWRDTNGRPPKSVTYINADVWDNPALLNSDPDYLSNLMAQSLVDRERFLGIKGRGGSWNSKAIAGKVFRQDWFEVVDQVPSILPGQAKLCRFWDFAATTKQLQGDDPDFTCGVKLMLLDGVTYVLDVIAIQTTPTEIDRLVQNTASQDGRWCMVRWEQEGGASGVRDSARLMQMLRGFDARGIHPEINKVGRAKPFSRAAEFGQVKLVRGAWNQAYLNELSQFPDGAHDDQVDASSGAFNELTGADVSRTSTGTFRV
ncbi:MAG TPA: phage terminase large subunit, partial [Allocoleopsis sp.]